MAANNLPSLDNMVDELTRWLAVESPTNDPAGVARMMDLVAAEADASGIASERIPGRDGLGPSLILRAGPHRSEGSADPGILVLSHLDTVHPVGTAERDLPIRVEGDRLYGPGVFDMKGGAYLALQAFKGAARATGEGAPKRPLVFLFTPDEETGSPTTRTLIEDLGREAAFVLVTEPCRDGGRVVTARKGVGRFNAHVEGRPAHAGSRHADGRNAIHEAARLIGRIAAMTDYGRGVTTTVGTIVGGTAENVVAQHCRFAIDLRVLNAADGEAFEREILGLAPGEGDFIVTVRGEMNRPPWERSEAGVALFERARAVARPLGIDLGEAPLSGGGSDGNFTAALGIPTLDGLGIDGDGAHTLHEHGLLSSIVPRMRLMEGLLTTL